MRRIFFCAFQRRGPGPRSVLNQIKHLIVAMQHLHVNLMLRSPHHLVDSDAQERSQQRNTPQREEREENFMAVGPRGIVSETNAR